jgi:hypothetical protein
MFVESRVFRAAGTYCGNQSNNELTHPRRKEKQALAAFGTAAEYLAPAQ